MNIIMKSQKYLMTILFIGQLYCQPNDTTYSKIYYNKSIDKNNLVVLGLTVNESTFDDIINKLGRSTIVEDGHEDAICYCSNKINDPTKVIFYRNDISDFVGFKITFGTIKYNHCYKTELLSINTIIKSGLKLDLTQKEVLSVLGEPTFKSQKYWEYSYWVQEKIENNIFDVCSTISIAFKRKRSISISVFKTVTN